MRISLQRGNIVYLLLSGLVYFFAVYIAPLILPRTLSVGSRITMTIIIALLATFIMIAYATKVKNDIDRKDRKHSFLVIFAIGLIGFIAMMILQALINAFLQYLSQFLHFQPNSQNTANVVQNDGFTPLMLIYIAMSFVFSYLYKVTNRIVTPMIAHISMNGLVMFVQIMMHGSGM